MASSTDELGAFCPGERVCVDGRPEGALAGLTFGAKDLFDVASHVTGAGSPDWARTHDRAERTALALERLVDAGASLVGKTAMDELAYGALGENVHYGTPVNPRARDRVPGGSSSGSASAVAGGLVDFALGSDSACSVRLPAALCALFGFRPTFGRVPTDGMIPLSPSLDTVGWFARDAELLERVGRVLLGSSAAPERALELRIADDAFALVDPRVREQLAPAVDALASSIGKARHIRILDPGAESGLEWLWYRVWSVQVREVWETHGEWIRRVRPGSRVLSEENFSVGASSTKSELREAWRYWLGLRAVIRERLPSNALLCIPTVAGLPPRRGADRAEQEAFTRPTLCLMGVAVVAGLPQITLPVAELDGCPLGLSLLGAAGSDEALLRLAVELSRDEASDDLFQVAKGE